MKAGDTVNPSVKDKRGMRSALWEYCPLICPEFGPCIRPKPEVMLQWQPQM